MRLGRHAFVVGAVQVAPIPRIRPREVPRHGGSEAHGASKSHRPNIKLALVAFWHGPAVCAESSRQIRHIRIVNARPGACNVTSKHRAASSGLLATAGEPASCTFLVPCIRDARVPQAAAGLLSGTLPPAACACFTMVIVRSDQGCSPRMASACSLYSAAHPWASGWPWATAVALLSDGHVSSALQVQLPMCRLGIGLRLRLAQLAAR
jgi:hypothetical protein